MSKQPEHLDDKITIRKQNRRTLAMRLSPYGQIDVLIPYWIKPNSREVKRFIKESLPKMEAIMADQEAAPQHQHTQQQMRRWLNAWAKKMQVKPYRVQFRDMYRKWGSCSSRGSVTLNTALQFLPRYLVEYIIVHELAHLIYLNHDTEFWNKVGEFMPDYQAYEQELNQYHL